MSTTKRHHFYGRVVIDGERLSYKLHGYKFFWFCDCPEHNGVLLSEERMNELSKDRLYKRPTIYSQLQIKSQSFPVRCEICHQVDLFDPKQNSCARCSGMQLPVKTSTTAAVKSERLSTARAALAVAATCSLFSLGVVIQIAIDLHAAGSWISSETFPVIMVIMVSLVALGIGWWDVRREVKKG